VLSARRAPLGKHLKTLERARCRFAVSSRIREVRENRCGGLAGDSGAGRTENADAGSCWTFSLIFSLNSFSNLCLWARSCETGYRFRRPFWPLSRSIHSRIYAGQFSSCTPLASQRARYFTASRFTSVTSFKSKTKRRSTVSKEQTRCNSSKCSASIRPLSVKITLPFADLWILSIVFCTQISRTSRAIQTPILCR
jgi:hypothetical protein